MSIGRLENTTNPIHLVTPDRIVVPMPKPFDAPAGRVPFHRMLESQNLANRISAPNRTLINRQPDTFEPSQHARLLPKLGEILPIAPTPPAAIQVNETRQVQLPATGRVLDLYL